MQKYDLLRMRKFSLMMALKRKRWLYSIPVGIAGLFFYMLALSYQSISIVQPLITSSLIIPVVAGHLFFREKIGVKWFHIILILGGAILLSL